jgi:hypothetical protein
VSPSHPNHTVIVNQARSDSIRAMVIPDADVLLSFFSCASSLRSCVTLRPIRSGTIRLCATNLPCTHVIVVTLIFTYLIPIVPFILVLDGYVSAYRSREFEHVSLSKSSPEDGVLRGWLVVIIRFYNVTSC